MRRRTIGRSASALLLLATVAQAHKGTHEHLEALHKRHREVRVAKRSNESIDGESFELAKRRGGQCAFPADAGLVAVTPGCTNAGWAMSPDQACEPGSYCPYACPSGQVSMQWDPKATSYSYPLSMNGGLYCDSNGQISKPFPDKPYCQQTATNIGVVNNAGGTVAFCQTVLPGNEAMLIPTAVDGHASLAVPGTDYWAGTAAHYYINPPGKSAGEACVWGTNSNPFGNWSPYVAGANQDASGQTFIKLGWNPVYLETTTPFRNTMPSWGVKIECPNGGCNGLPCAIDPSSGSVNGMKGGSSSGAGGGNFCVVTVPKGATANFVVYEGSDSGSSSSGSSSSSSPSASAYSKSKGGQFYQSSVAPSSSSTTSSASTSSPSAVTTTKATTTVSTTTSASSSMQSSATSGSEPQSALTTWSMWNATTQRTGSTGQPLYALLNTTTPSTTEAAETATSMAATSTLSASITIASHTSGAAAFSFSMLVFAPIALWSLL